jgi:hypothetical protein
MEDFNLTEEMGVDLLSENNKFIIRGKKFHITYKKHIEPEKLKNYINKKFEIQEYVF